jgi:predicted transcriptional regulator
MIYMYPDCGACLYDIRMIGNGTMKIVGRGEDTMIESSDAEKLERMQKNLRKANRSAYQRKKEAGMVRINFWIPGELKERFDKVAADEPHKKEDLMTQAIEEFCDRKIGKQPAKAPKIIKQAEAERPEDPENKFCKECVKQHPTCKGCCELCTLFDDYNKDPCPHGTNCLMPYIPIGKSIDEICPECDGFGCDHCDEGWVTKSG